jgi:hypothetical protein
MIPLQINCCSPFRFNASLATTLNRLISKNVVTSVNNEVFEGIKDTMVDVFPSAALYDFVDAKLIE